MKHINLLLVVLLVVSLGVITSYNAITREQSRLIDMQDSLIQTLEKHCWEEHDCDLPMLDGDIELDINESKEKIKQLSNFI